jgi:ubiquinone biosynthesis protein COQ9
MTHVPPETRLLVQAALPQVPFDGWSEATLHAAAAEVGIPLSRLPDLLPRGAVDLAAAAHYVGDEAMVRRLAATDLAGMRFRERVALALRIRLEVSGGREAVRRASALFTLPHLAPTGAALIWGTADAVWTALGDTATDGNWYSKRAMLAAVWSATVLFWLGDDSDNAQATAEFIDRRIGNIMAVEAAKAKLPKALSGPLNRLMGAVRAPGARDDLPGQWKEGTPHG